MKLRRQPKHLYMDTGAQNPAETPWYWRCTACDEDGHAVTEDEARAAYKAHRRESH